MPVIGLRFEAAFGGGPLHQWNQYLWARHLAVLRNQQLGKVEDESSRWSVGVRVVGLASDAPTHSPAPEANSPLMMLDANGNPFELAIPQTGIPDEAAREALIQIALSRLPGGAMVEPALRQMIPLVGLDVIAAAENWWHQKLGALNLAKRASQASSAANTATAEVSEWLQADQVPTVYWVGPRQQRIMNELRIDAADAIAGEEHLKAILLNRPPSQIPRVAKGLEQSIQTGIKQLGRDIKQDAPALFGSHARLKRAIHRAIKDFQKSSERHFRNHKGIRGNRLRQLAQALQPGGQEQQFGLSLISAMALFHLQPKQIVEQLDLFHGARAQSTMLVNCETGIRSSISLSC